jgi:hypothetical protein
MLVTTSNDMRNVRGILETSKNTHLREIHIMDFNTVESRFSEAFGTGKIPSL